VRLPVPPLPHFTDFLIIVESLANCEARSTISPMGPHENRGGFTPSFQSGWHYGVQQVTRRNRKNELDFEGHKEPNWLSCDRAAQFEVTRDSFGTGVMFFQLKPVSRDSCR
jgi:hypothetical protein